MTALRKWDILESYTKLSYTVSYQELLTNFGTSIQGAIHLFTEMFCFSFTFTKIFRAVAYHLVL